MATIYSNNETININPTDDLVLYKEEFINSRIEKFLYAICALDFDDLPIPLSRIEELYKCLATGLPAPTFVPQSRVEKYLMAILGAYDASALPAPQSRTEVLLNKILMGDTDLSDIDWLKSRYEFLLAYIAKSGEISYGSDNDFEYLQYIFSSSAYSIVGTKELPVKSAVLKGDTLVNLSRLNGETTITPGSIQYIDSSLIKSSTTYTISFNCSNAPSTGFIEFRQIFENTALKMENITVTQGYNRFTITTVNSVVDRFRLKNDSTSETDFIFNNLMILEGDYTDVDIPYFEGIGSVKMPVLKTTGKNLYPYGNIEFISTYDSWHDSVGTPEMWGDIGSISKARFFLRKGQYVFSANFDTVENFKGFTLVGDDESMIFGYTIGNNDANEFVVSNDMYLTLRVKLLNKDTHTFMENIQIEEGSVATEYEPYKSTTVTCNEEVELRGVGDFKDELDLLTGEVTQRVAEIVLDGSEDEVIYRNTTKEITQVFKIEISDSLFSIGYKEIFISDSLPNNASGDTEKFVSEIYDSDSAIYVALNKTKASTVSEFKEYLSKNPLTILGPAKNQSMETVNLATKDQDGNEAELSSFEDITHVTVTSEGILPDVELSVAKYYPYLTFLLESVSMDTLYNTKELPVKSAILKGQTMVNLTCHGRQLQGAYDDNLTEGRLTWTTNAEWQRVYFVVNGEPNTKYIIKYQSIHENVEIYYRLDTTNINQSGAERIYSSNSTFTTGETGTFIISLENTTASSDLWVQDFMIIEYQDGMENWDIPYFEGIGSVRMPVLKTVGKNLFDGVWSPDTWIDVNTGDTQLLYNRASLMNKISVKESTTYTYKFTHSSTKDISGRAVYLYDKNGSFLNTISPYISSGTFTTTSNTGYINFCVYATTGEDITDDDIATFILQIEEGSVATEYEPYKSTTVTCNEEVELRGIGDVKDELDLLTGELTQRIGEIVLDGDESWTYSGYSTTNYPAFFTQIKDSENVLSYTNFICDRFANKNVKDNTTIEGAQMNKNDSNNSGANFLIRIDKEKLSSNDETGFTEYLRNNPITVYHTLNTEVGGSANITTKDQDGNEAELSSFEDITHVTVTSEGILPDVELSVANQFEEDLTTLSLRMNNIATTQEGLEESVDEQTQEVDSTMMATTEIYEGLL